MGRCAVLRARGSRQVHGGATDARVVHASNVAPELSWYRIRLGEVIALRDVPALCEEVRRAVAVGARVVELDASDLRRMTDGARALVEAAQRRWAEHAIDLRFTVPLARTG